MADLTYPGGKLRLFVDAALAEGARVETSSSQAHYLIHVMRARLGDQVALFNGRDGEWLAHLAEFSRRQTVLLCTERIAPQTVVPDLWFAFAPVKKTAAEYVVQKATELGVRRLIPVITRRTIVRKVNPERLAANAIEAAEQSGRREVPMIAEVLTLEAMLARWPQERALVFCDEAGDAPPIADAVMALRGRPSGVLIGPEGGFEPMERAAIRAKGFACPVSLGTRILRADTAGLAALAVWQAVAGDWRVTGA
ncbi:MAG: 16S rRNA (uracil(1498)-N(3))-methyltransferase [Rhizomicrobium sp.]